MEPEISIFDESYGLAPVTYASTGQRFGNYIIDQIILYVGNLVLGRLLGYFLLTTEFRLGLARSMGLWGVYIFSFLIGMGISILYYVFMEGAFGKTVGKFATGTKVVRTDGQPLRWKDVLLRTLCRYIPFEPFSALGGRPWHDSLTKTAVVIP